VNIRETVYLDEVGRLKRFWRSITGIAYVDEQSFWATLDRIDIIVKRGSKTRLEAAWSIVGRIEAKAAAYLQHISMMIALIGVLLAVYAETRLEQAILVLELIAYLALALSCIRCLYHVGAWEITGGFAHRAESSHWDSRETAIGVSEVALREWLFRVCTKWLWRLTVIFALTLFLHISIGGFVCDLNKFACEGINVE
jgi:hypothetical protein